MRPHKPDAQFRKSATIIGLCLIAIVMGGVITVSTTLGPSPDSQVRSIVYAPSTQVVRRPDAWRDEIRSMNDADKK